MSSAPISSRKRSRSGAGPSIAYFAVTSATEGGAGNTRHSKLAGPVLTKRRSVPGVAPQDSRIFRGTVTYPRVCTRATFVPFIAVPPSA